MVLKQGISTIKKGNQIVDDVNHVRNIDIQSLALLFIHPCLKCDNTCANQIDVLLFFHRIQKWNDSISSLDHLVNEEIVQIKTGEGISAKKSLLKKDTTTVETFDYHALLYVRYILVFSKLEDFFNSLTQPQLRDAIKSTLELIICRVIDLRHKLSKCSKYYCIGSERCQQTTPVIWEYFDLSKQLMKMKIPAKAIETPIPTFLKGETTKNRGQRDALIKGYMELKLNADKVQLENNYLEESNIYDRSNEARQRITGEQNAVKDLIELSEPPDFFCKGCKATVIQSYFRGYLTRRIYREKCNKERQFVGMQYKSVEGNKKIEMNMRYERSKKRQMTKQNREEYELALKDLKQTVKREESFEMKENLREERIKWVTEEIVRSNEIPVSLDRFYDSSRNIDDNENIDTPPKKDKKKGDKSKKDKKGKTESKSEKNVQECAGVLNASLFQPPEILLLKLKKNIEDYRIIWHDDALKSTRDEKISLDIAKNLFVRNFVLMETVKEVDEILVSNLRNIQSLHSKGEGEKRTKPNKSAGASKVSKGTKVNKMKRLLPGEKITSLKNMDTAHMLSMLVEFEMITMCDNQKVENLLGSAHSDYLSCENEINLIAEKVDRC